MNWKKKFEEARRKVDSILGHPIVDQVSSVGEDLLDIAYKLAQTGINPISIGGAVSSTVAALQHANIIRSTSAIGLFREKHKLENHKGLNLYDLLIENDIINEKNNIKVAIDRDEELIGNDLGDGNTIYGLGFYNRDSAMGNDHESYSSNFFISENFNKSKVADLIWKKYNTGIFLQTSGEDNALVLNKFTTSNDDYICDIDIDEFADSLVDFKSQSISRGYLLLGPPGVGKTTMVSNLAKRFGNRFIKIDPSVMLKLDNSSLSVIFDFFKPEIVVMDDFDRAESEKFLFLLENMKNTFPNITLFGTVNYIDLLDAALVRPGRFDEPIWFEYPDEPMRRAVLCSYAKKYNISLTSDQIVGMAMLTEGLSQAHLKELIIKVKQKGISCAEAVVKNFHRLDLERKQAEKDED